MSFPPAYLLVAHGSSDPRPQIALERLAYLVSDQLRESCRQRSVLPERVEYRGDTSGRIALLSPPSTSIVRTAILECHPLPLHGQIIEIAEDLLTQGYKILKILPLFLLPGVHVQEDLPREVALAQGQLGNRMGLEIAPYLGSLAAFVELIRQQCEFSETTARILVAHGSRRPGGNSSVQALARICEAEVAYSSITPHLASVVEQVNLRKPTTIQVIPYLLFTGGLSDAIAAEVKTLQKQYPTVQFSLAHPLGTNPTLASIIAAQGKL
ncbi:MAG: sirohydrochlorin chelatase [Snowella sp.]|nr:sirohydrochlorin chelatase [Snowella sp.]